MTFEVDRVREEGERQPATSRVRERERMGRVQFDVEGVSGTASCTACSVCATAQCVGESHAKCLLLALYYWLTCS